MQFVKIERIPQSKLEKPPLSFKCISTILANCYVCFYFDKEKKDTFNNVPYFRVGYVEFYF